MEPKFCSSLAGFLGVVEEETMTFDVRVAFGGGSSRLSNKFEDLGDAASHTLGLADSFGKNPGDVDGYGFPKTVEIHQHNELILSVAILPGGLLTANDDR